MDDSFSGNPKNLYEVLGIVHDADKATIRTAFHNQVLKYHPDRNPRVSNKLKNIYLARFQEIQQAYEVLGDIEQRRRYDESMRRHILREKRLQNSPEAPVADLSLRPKAKKTVHSPPYTKVAIDPLLDATKISRGRRKAGTSTPRAPPPVREVHGTYLGVQGMVNETVVYALPDTGADMNFMSSATAADLRLEFTGFDVSERPHFTMGNGRRIFAIAQVAAVWKFQDTSELEYETVFYILKDCIFDVMLGAHFLYQTRTMDVHRERLCRLPRPEQSVYVRFVNLCGRPSRRLVGHIENKPCQALPDSGAEPNLVSYQFVRQRGWAADVFPGPPSCRLLQFADGSTEHTIGRLKLRWTFSKTSPGQTSLSQHEAIFDVLRDCPYDVILGQDFLEQTEAFELHGASFVEVMVEGGFGLNTVMWAPKLRTRLLKKISRSNDSKKDDGSPLKHLWHPQTGSGDDANDDLSDNELEIFAKSEYDSRRQMPGSTQPSVPNSGKTLSQTASPMQTGNDSSPTFLHSQRKGPPSRKMSFYPGRGIVDALWPQHKQGKKNTNLSK